MFFHFRATRRDENGAPERFSIIVPCDPNRPADGYWVARLEVFRRFGVSAEIRERTTRQVWPEDAERVELP